MGYREQLGAVWEGGDHTSKLLQYKIEKQDL